VPYIGLVGLKAEDGIGSVLNWIVKASIATAFIYYAFPAIRATLTDNQAVNQPALTRKLEYRRRRAEAAKSRFNTSGKI
jgi:hypothetical protein